MIAAYTTPSTVNEVSATFVATMNRRQSGGAGANTRTYNEKWTDQQQFYKVCNVIWSHRCAKKELHKDLFTGPYYFEMKGLTA